MTQTQAFLSYTRRDDKYFKKNITSLRELLELGVQVVTGNPNFEIFQDVEGIELGQQWEKRIENALTSAKFLIPVVTPLFLASPPCREEFSKFVEHEKFLGRDDLILPIYYVTAPTLEKPELRNADPVAVELNKRQRFDWRERAGLPINNPSVRKAIRELSEEIAQALQRSQEVIVERHRVNIAKRAKDNQLDRRFEDASEQVVGQETAPNPQKKAKIVLWVDDRPDNNFYEREALKRYGVEFVLATSTAEALKLLERDNFDAIISDMGRPPDPTAGYTLLDAVRTKGNGIPYFIYAGSRSQEHKDETARRGGQGTTNIPSELLPMVLDALGLDESLD